MSDPVRFESAIDKAFKRVEAARMQYLQTGGFDALKRAVDALSNFHDVLKVPSDQRWPRDPETLRILTPSEIARNGQIRGRKA